MSSSSSDLPPKPSPRPGWEVHWSRSYKEWYCGFFHFRSFRKESTFRTHRYYYHPETRKSEWLSKNPSVDASNLKRSSGILTSSDTSDAADLKRPRTTPTSGAGSTSSTRLPSGLPLAAYATLRTMMLVPTAPVTTATSIGAAWGARAASATLALESASSAAPALPLEAARSTLAQLYYQAALHGPTAASQVRKRV
jgi:hypothetical protein